MTLECLTVELKSLRTAGMNVIVTLRLASAIGKGILHHARPFFISQLLRPVLAYKAGFISLSIFFIERTSKPIHHQTNKK